MKKNSIYLFILPLILACNVHTNNFTNIKENNNFKIKGITNIENTELEYHGNWNLNNNVHNSSFIKNDNDSSLSYSGDWTTINLANATFKNSVYSNIGNNFELANDTSSSVTYTKNGWLTYSNFTYNDINSSNIYKITNQETDINKIKYIYTGSLGGGPKEEEWSNSMHPAWRTSTNSEGISYTESRESTSKIKIPFSGTNIQVYHFKTSLMGQCNIKVYDSSNNLLRDIPVNLNNPTWLLSKTVINGLPNGNNKLVIEGVDGNRFNFVRAEVLPSIEYKFNGNNIIYNTIKANNSGKVAITIDNDPTTTQVVDLYSSSTFYENVYSKYGLNNNQHTITIDALGERNLSSTGFRISLNQFTAFPSVVGEFTGTFLNLKLVKVTSYGIVDLYIDGNLNQSMRVVKKVVSRSKTSN